MLSNIIIRRAFMLLILVFYIQAVFGIAREETLWRRYTTEDGLSQNTVMSILQDRKGFLWFSTWDGLSRFDGYNFYSYKIQTGDDIPLSSSRIDLIEEDVFGYIWLQGYSGNVTRFDPVREEFVSVPGSEFRNITITSIVTLSNGITWLLTDADGGFRVTTNSQTGELAWDLYSIKTALLESNVINKVHVDVDENEWILTDNGISIIYKGQSEAAHFFFESKESYVGTRQSFYSVLDTGDEVWLGSSKGRVWRYMKKGGRFLLHQVETESAIVSIEQLNDNRFFIATQTDGFFIYDATANTSEHFKHSISGELISDVIYGTFKDSCGDVWIQQETSSIAHYVSNENKIINHKVVSTTFDGVIGPKFMIHEDVNGLLWIHPHGGGLSFYDRKTGLLRPFFSSPESLNMFSDRLHSMFSDRQGNLWMCTRARGLDKFVFHHQNFNLITPVKNQQILNENDIRVILEDSSGNLWVTTKTGRVAIYNNSKQLLGFLGLDGQLHASELFTPANIYSIIEDANGYLWMGSKGQGLLRVTPPSISGQKNYLFTNFKFDKNDIYSLSHNDVYTIYEDGKGNLWIGTYGGGVNLMQKNSDGKVRFINHRNHLNGYPINSCSRVRYVTSDMSNNIWVGTTNGLIVFNEDFVEPESIFFNHYAYLPGRKDCLSNNDVHNILITSKREVFIATFGGGLNKLISSTNGHDYKFKSYTKNDGLAADVLLSMIETSNGNIWIATENGLSQFNAETEEFRNYTRSDFTRVLSFSEGSGFVQSNGTIMFGTNQGVLYFHPDSIEKSSFIPPITFTEFRLFNRKVNVGDNSILDKHIDETKNIMLRHNQNMISVGFAALDMKYPETVKYMAILEGFDTEWKFLDNYRMINYTNLPAGEYTLRVRSTNSDGIWVDNERTLPITIKPSFWVTPMAYLIYIIVFLLIGGVSVYILLFIYKLKNRIEIEHEVSDMKLNFFTNISHELRTPLTLITGPLEQVLQDESLSAQVKDKLLLVEKSSSRMLRLINQILDFVKISNNKMKMRVEMIPLNDFVERVMDNFRLQASDSDIEFTCTDNTNGQYVWADADKLEKIIFNLLSNAFKYLDKGKFVKVLIEPDENGVLLKVQDNGLGITESQQAKVFNRFESLSAKSDAKKPSTGIGLALVKDLVEMHGATIHISNSDSQGSEFVIFLKKGLDHFNDDVEIVDNDAESFGLPNAKTFDISQSVDFYNEDDSSFVNGRSTLLLVEDNVEVRSFIRSVLKDDYNILEAGDGVEGFRKAMEFIPDLIISDLMMPEKDGMELLRQIRSHIDTSHIPFVLLSAKSNLDSRLAGLEKGADDYITKPFSPAHLKVRISNLLEQRLKLQHLYQGKADSAKLDLEPSMPEVTSFDEKFMADLKELMEKNMENSNLVIDDMVRDLGFSRSVFFKKLKALTGLAPIEYIREMRLKRAAQLIEIGEHNMTQIAFMVGMNDPRYFSKCFKQKFGVTPSVYKSKHQTK